MSTNDTPPAEKLSFSTITQLYLELQQQKDRTSQLEKRLFNTEQEIKGLCAIAEDAAHIDEIISNLMSQVETLSAKVEILSSQVAALSQPTRS